MSTPPSADADMTALIDAWQSAHDDLLDLVESLDDADWQRPTDLPGWSVADLVAHITWLEALLLGEFDPPHEPDWDSLPHVTSDFARFTEVPVDRRRSWSREAVMLEFRDVLDRRAEALREGPQDAQAPHDGSFGPKTLGGVVRQRSFDTWVHEQDIRRAVNRPGNLDSPGAQATAAQLIPGLPMIVAKRAGARPGDVVHLSVTPPGVAFTATVVVDADGRARIVADDLVDQAGPATTTITMPWESWVLATCGRAGEWRAHVEITGDADLAERVLANLALTP